MIASISPSWSGFVCVQRRPVGKLTPTGHDHAGLACT
jgi:hypothetical protein